MGLPKFPREACEVVIRGTTVSFVGLTRAEALGLAQFRDGTAEPTIEQVAAFEAYLIAKATEVSEAEAARWREETDAEVVDVLTTAILIASGLAKEGQPDPKPSTNGSSSRVPATASTTS
jgi:hypothetical protein